MYLRPDAQRQGIGSQMLAEFDRLLNAKRIRTVFLTCGPHLEAFYGQVGFRLAGEGDGIPEFLIARRNGYTSRYGEQIIMCRRSP
jgi:GNAT superfamily N-acetyltransferase